MKVTASLKNYGRPARKMRDLIALVKGLPVKKALDQLAIVSRYGARDLEKLIMSAVANAKNNYDLREEGLTVADVIIDGGTVLKRWMPRAYGNANRILKRSCHIEVVLEGEEAEKKGKIFKKGIKKTENQEKVEKQEKGKEEEVVLSKERKEKDEKIGWQKEEKEVLKEDRKSASSQNWGKKVFRRKSF